MDGSKSTDQLIAEYRKLAKRADQRMVRLEAARYTPGYENVLKYAYARAQKDLRKWASSAKLKSKQPLRFNTAVPKTKTGAVDVRSLQNKINVIQRFLHSDTGSINPTKESRGIKALYQDRVDRLNKKYQTAFTWETLAKYFEDGTADKLAAKYGSKTALRIIGQIQKKPKEVIQQLNAVGEKRIKSDNPFLNKKVNEVLNKYGADIKDLL